MLDGSRIGQPVDRPRVRSHRARMRRFYEHTPLGTSSAVRLRELLSDIVAICHACADPRTPEVITDPRNFSIKRRSDSSLRTSSFDSPAEFAIATSVAGLSMQAMLLFTAFCTFSKAHTSICRTRSRDTPNSSASSWSVIEIIGEATRLEDAALAIIEHREPFTQSLVAVVRLLGLGETALLADAVVDQPIYPFVGIAVLADRRIERGVTAKPALYIDHILLRHAKPLGDEFDLIGPHIALVESGNPALGFAKIEEQLLLIGGGTHLNERPRS